MSNVAITPPFSHAYKPLSFFSTLSLSGFRLTFQRTPAKLVYLADLQFSLNAVCHSVSFQAICSLFCLDLAVQESFRAISTAQLRVTTFTPAAYLRRRLQRPLCGSLILGGASCLDAFSTYPYQTRIPSNAPGGTTGKPEVCPTRSSRTSVGSSQTSYAHNR